MGPPGHFAIGFAAKSVEPSGPLWALLIATEIPDLLFFGFEAMGFEQQAITKIDLGNGMQVLQPGIVPWSHGLMMTMIWSIVIAIIGYLVSRKRRVGGVLGLMVLSHWLLDFVVHPPDLPLLLKGSPKVGLNLWGSGPGYVLSILLELTMLALGVAIYLKGNSRGTERAG